MEGSGGGFLQQPGARGPEGKQVCFMHQNKSPIFIKLQVLILI